MRHLIRAATLLLCVTLGAFYVALEQTRFLLAAAAIFSLVEIALALRARAGHRTAPADPSRIAAAQVACTEQDGAVAVTLSGAADGGPGAPYVLLSRKLRSPADASAHAAGPYLELSDPRRSVQAGIRDAYLSPQLLQLALDDRAAEAVGAETVCVTLPAGTDQRRLERTLSRILRGVPFTSDRSMPEAEAESPASITS